MLRKQLTARSILVLAFSWVVFGTSEAANAQPTLASETCARYASPSGSDANAGTAVRPVRSAQKLANSLAAGETGCMYAGSYPGNLAIASGGITLTSVAGGRALLLGYVWIKDSADGVTLADLDIDGHAAAPITVQVQGDGALLRGLDITNRNKLNSSYTGSCLLLGVVGAPAFDPTIERSRIHNCGGGNGGHDHAIYSEFARRAVIRNNYLYDNPGFGISMYPDTQSSLIEHNVIDGNGYENRGNLTFSGEVAGGEYSQDYASSNNVVRYNLITNSRSRYHVDSFFPSTQVLPIGNVVSSNCLWNAPWGSFTSEGGFTTSGNKEVDPLYVDPTAKDFRLRDGSPCAGWGPTTAGEAAPAPDFSLSVAPDPANVTQGGTAVESVSIGSVGGFSSDVDLSVAGVPAGTTASLVSSTVSAGGSTELSLTPSTATASGTYTVTVTGRSGSTAHSEAVTLAISPGPSFSLSAAPTKRAVARGKGTTYTITTTPSNGFAAGIALAVTGLPRGATASFNANPLGGSATASSLLTIKTSTTTPTGNYTLAVTGTGGGVTQKVSLTLQIKRR